MVTKAFTECLVDVYRGEVGGEAFFEGMLRVAEDAEQRYVIGSLLQFETEGKAIIRPLLMRLGLSMLEDAEARSVNAAGAVGVNSLPWVDRFGAIQEAVKSIYLPRYLELATLVTQEEDAEAARIAAFMGAHERAVAAVAANVISGRPDPVAPAVALLHFPLLRAA